VLSSIVQIWMGPLSVLADGVLVPPPHAAVHNATAKRPMAVICFVYLFFIEPPDPKYPFVPNGSHLKVDGDSIKVGQNAEVDRLLPMLPQNATTYRFFLEKWNAFLYLAGGGVELSWDDGEAFI